MSIVIRLQNLPLHAKAGDIRRFFSGLRIPNGGVHIIGGKKGDAFIVFISDEDARLAMKKDGCKLMDARVKLYLSSHLELQQEIEQITGKVSDISRKGSPIRKHRDSRSPFDQKSIHTDWDYQSNSVNRERKGYSHRSPSPRKIYRSPTRSKILHKRSVSPRRFDRKPKRSVSPRRFSRSPRRSVSPRRISRSPRRSVSPRRFSRSPRRLVSPRRISRSPRRSMTPNKFSVSLRRSMSPRTFTRSVTIRSRSPRRLSRSPKRGSIMHGDGFSAHKRKSISPTRSYSPAKQRGSPHHRKISPHRRDAGSLGAKKDNDLLKIEEIFGVEQYFKSNSELESKQLSQKEKHTLFEQKISEALALSLTSIQNRREFPQPSGHSLVSKLVETGQLTRSLHTQLEAYPAQYSTFTREFPIQEVNNFCMPDTHSTPRMQTTSFFAPDVQSRQDPLLQFQPTPNLSPVVGFSPHMETLAPRSPEPPRYRNTLPLNTNPSKDIPQNPSAGTPPNRSADIPQNPSAVISQNPSAVISQNPSADIPTNPFFYPSIPDQFFFVSLSDVPKNWEERSVSDMLRGIFLPLKNIKFDLDNDGYKTGTVHLKLCNRQDFKCLLSHSTYCYRQLLITVNVCPGYVSNKYFPPEMPSEASLNSQRGNYCYKMTGLQRDTVFEDILNFFAGLEITDIYIVKSKNNEGQGFKFKEGFGNAFVAFSNLSHYRMAFTKNDQPFVKGNKIIRLFRIPRRKMLEVKEFNGDHLSQSSEFVPSEVTPVRVPVPSSSQVRPLCTLLTGLPQNVTVKQIYAYFKAVRAQPGRVHILLDDNREPNGRAFIEFNSFSDFDAACKCHGSQFVNSIISVKQILYDEMLKGLESQKEMHTFSRYNSNKNIPRKDVSYSRPPFSVHENAHPMPSQRFPLQDGLRMPHNDDEFISGRANVQVFDYGNESSKPHPVSDTTPDPLDTFVFERQVPQRPSDFENRNSFYGKVAYKRGQGLQKTDPPWKEAETHVSVEFEKERAISMSAKKGQKKKLSGRPESSAVSFKPLPVAKNNGNMNDTDSSKSKPDLSKKNSVEVEVIVLESSSSETEDSNYCSSKKKSKNMRWGVKEGRMSPLRSSTRLRHTSRPPHRSKNYFDYDSNLTYEFPTFN